MIDDAGVAIWGCDATRIALNVRTVCQTSATSAWLVGSNGTACRWAEIPAHVWCMLACWVHRKRLIIALYNIRTRLQWSGGDAEEGIAADAELGISVVACGHCSDILSILHIPAGAVTERVRLHLPWIASLARITLAVGPVTHGPSNLASTPRMLQVHQSSRAPC
jgi:hypothetical protein